MKLTVYNISGAPRGWRVLVGLTLKGLGYEVRYLDGSKAEQKGAEFLKINPRGLVPVLDANGVIVRDSIAILAWLDRRYPDKPLFGKSVDEGARVWQQTMECSEFLQAATRGFLYPILVEDILLPELQGEQLVSLQTAANTMHAELRHLENLLADQTYLCGDQPSAAEAVAFPDVRLVQRALDRKGDVMGALGFADAIEQYPSLFEWMHRVGSIEGMDGTLPYHW